MLVINYRIKFRYIISWHSVWFIAFMSINWFARLRKSYPPHDSTFSHSYYINRASFLWSPSCIRKGLVKIPIRALSLKLAYSCRPALWSTIFRPLNPTMDTILQSSSSIDFCPFGRSDMFPTCENYAFRQFHWRLTSRTFNLIWQLSNINYRIFVGKNSCVCARCALIALFAWLSTPLSFTSPPIIVRPDETLLLFFYINVFACASLHASSACARCVRQPREQKRVTFSVQTTNPIWSLLPDWQWDRAVHYFTKKCTSCSNMKLAK